MEQLLTSAPPQHDIKRNSHGAAQDCSLPCGQTRLCPALRSASSCPVIPSLAVLLIHLQKWFAAFDFSPMRSFTFEYKTHRAVFWHGLTASEGGLFHSLAYYVLGHHVCFLSC